MSSSPKVIEDLPEETYLTFSRRAFHPQSVKYMPPSYFDDLEYAKQVSGSWIWKDWPKESSCQSCDLYEFLATVDNPLRKLRWKRKAEE